jgi:ribosome biogenesis GTPase A
MSINWFPGHMNKARRMLKERVAKSDMVIEVLDARLPNASRNPMLQQICRGVPRLCVLTKPDLADPKVTAAWLKVLARQGARSMELVATDPKSKAKLIRACRDLVPKRGHPGFPVRVMIAGIPNVGKSSLFNLLVGKKKAMVRDQPAVTRSEQRIDVPGGLSLVDTPGVLWPKLDDVEGAYRLAASGAIREVAFDPMEVGRFIVDWLVEAYPEALGQRFGVNLEGAQADDLLLQIAERRGAVTRGKGPDLRKAAELLLHDLRAGKLGRLSLESPADLLKRRRVANPAAPVAPESDAAFPRDHSSSESPEEDFEELDPQYPEPEDSEPEDSEFEDSELEDSELEDSEPVSEIPDSEESQDP